MKLDNIHSNHLGPSAYQTSEIITNPLPPTSEAPVEINPITPDGYSLQSGQISSGMKLNK